MSTVDASSHPEHDWIALPGLFEASEIVELDDLELRACPLVIKQGRVFYGVYVRDLSPGANDTLKRPAA